MSLTHVIFILFALTSHTVYSQTEAGDTCTIQRFNERGVCRLISQCPEVTRRLREQRIRPTTCGFRGSQTIVCCPSNEPPPNENQNKNRQSSQTNAESNSNNFGTSQKRISERKCDEYSSRVVTVVEALPLLPDSEPLSFKVASCEYSNVPLIVGGEEVNVGEFPHMAAIGWPLANKNDFAWNCGGSLISENYVLTAGHCSSDDRNTELASPTPTMVRLGEHNLKSDDDGADPQNIKISSIIKHPEYKPPMKYHDIALIKLESPARFNKFVRPACLWQKPTYPQQSAIATGWGRIDYAEDPSDVLRRVSIKIIDQNVCKSLYSSRNRKLVRGIVDEQLCAGDLNGGKDTCQGDSGGPLQVSETNNLCIFYIVGVTSFGAGCGGKNTPGVYTRVSSYIDWIERTVWPEERQF